MKVLCPLLSSLGVIIKSTRNHTRGHARKYSSPSASAKGVVGIALATVLTLSLGSLPAMASPDTSPSSTPTLNSSIPATPLPSPVLSDEVVVKATQENNESIPPSTPLLAKEVASETKEAAPLEVSLLSEPLEAVSPVEPPQTENPPTSGLGAKMGQGIKKDDSVKNSNSRMAAPFAATPLAMPAGVYGMDVSGWQADAYSHSVSTVDWNKQWNMGSRFVYVKGTEGTNFVDASRNSHLKGAKAVGMLTGAYHFALPGQGTATSQADFFVNNGGTWTADGKSMPPLLDIEYNPYSSLGNTCYNLSAPAMVKWIADFSNRVKSRTGRLPMIYTTTDWWQRCTGNSAAFSDQPLHIAAYSSVLGALPNGWDFHSVWQYSSTGPFDGDSNLWNGTLDSLKKFAGLPVIYPGGGDITPIVPKPPVMVTPPSIRSAGDVVAADASGTLWNYPATGKAGLGSRVKIGSGWTGLRSISVTDWNADGVFDIIAQWNNGKVTTYLGLPNGGFKSGPVLANSGWAGNQLAVGPWINGQKYPQIVSRESNGTLRLWTNPSGSALGSSRVIGNGWGGLDIAMIDFDGSGTQDLLARNAGGDMILYRSNGKGDFVSQARPKVGSGWNNITSLSVAADFNGRYSVGIIARTNAGALLYYPTPGNSTFGQTFTIGNSWNPMLIAGGENIPVRTVVAPVPKPPVIPVAPPVTPTGPPQAPSGVPAIASANDAVTIDSSGRLLVRKYTASGSYKTAVQIGHGFQAFGAVQPTDFNSDGVQDLIAQRNDKSISVYYGSKTGGFSSSRVIANAGWDGKDILMGKWKTTDKYPGIVSINAKGDLMYWNNPNGLSLTSGQRIGNSWGSLRIAMVDFDSDKKQDILAVQKDGKMLLYRGTGTGGFVYENRSVVGQGWGGITKFRGTSSPAGMSAVSGNKELRFYPVAKPKTWGTMRVVASPFTDRVNNP